MKKLILSLLFSVPLLLSAQFDISNTNAINFSEDADGQGGDIGISDSLFIGWTGTAFSTVFDTTGKISKYGGSSITDGYTLVGSGGKLVLTPGAGAGVVDFTDLADVPSSYSGQPYNIVSVNSAADGLEFTSEIQESGTNFRLGSTSLYGTNYNTVIGYGSRMNSSSSRNTYIGYKINNAGNNYNENTIIGPSELAVNAGTMTIVGSVINHARVAGMVALGTYFTMPTSNVYSYAGTNSPIYIGYNINNSETAPATKSNIFIGKNISTSGFTSNATTNAIIISQDPTLEDGLQNAIGIGQGVNFLDAEPNSVAIGDFATIYLDPTYGNGGGQSVAIGLYAKAGSWRSLSLGAYSQALAVSSTAIGFGAYSNHPHSDSWGRGAYNDLEDATLIYGSPSTGSTNIGTVYFGTIAAKHLNPAMPAGGETLDLSTELNAGTAYTTLTTTTGRDATASPSLTNTRGGEFRFMGGASTGTANGGDLVFGVTLAGGVSNNTVNTWDEALRIKGADGHLYLTLDPDNDETNTSFLMRDASSGEVEETALETVSANANKSSFRDNRFTYYNELLNAIGTATGGADIITTSSGTSAATNNVTTDATNRVGLVRSTTGTTTTGRTSPSTSSTAIALGGGAWTYEIEINIAALSNGTDRYQLVIGFFDVQTAANQTDAVAFVYDDGGVSTGSAASGNWQTLTSSNSTRTWTTTSTAVATGWVNLKIEVNAAGNSVTYYINGVAMPTAHTTNIPTGTSRVLGFGYLMIKSLGTTARTMDVDYIFSECDFTTRR